MIAAVLFTFVCSISLGILSLQRGKKIRREAQAQREAVCLHCDMSQLMRELFDDPTMNTQKWKEWLPIFEAADDEVERKTSLHLGRNSNFIYMIINGHDQPQL